MNISLKEVLFICTYHVDISNNPLCYPQVKYLFFPA